jgi:hypothetical protein
LGDRADFRGRRVFQAPRGVTAATAVADGGFDGTYSGLREGHPNPFCATLPATITITNDHLVYRHINVNGSLLLTLETNVGSGGEFDGNATARIGGQGVFGVMSYHVTGKVSGGVIDAIQISSNNGCTFHLALKKTA